LKAGLGGRIAFLRQSEGFNLDLDGNVNEYINGSLYNSSSIDIVGALNLGYKWSDRTNVYTYFNANKSLSNWSTESAVSYRPTLIQLGLGLKYKL